MENSSKKNIIAAQLSTVHSSAEMLLPKRVYSYVEKIVKKVALNIIIVGWEEKVELFNELTSKEKRLSDEVFLWYPFLSDYPDFNPSHLVVNINDIKSKGWGGYDGTGINETFKQACPNNPDAVSNSLSHLERLLKNYAFDGVFIDKIRFPSMANGLQDVFSCFCSHCMKKAAESKLDLEQVKLILESRGRKILPGTTVRIPEGADWLVNLIANQPILQQFVRFRADSINQVVIKISSLVQKMNKKMSLDVFSPGLAPLVGQDFRFMAHHAAWVKPMIYRFGNGPSSLRSEVPALIHELSHYLNLQEDDVMKWCVSHVHGLNGVSLPQIEKVAPITLLKEETRQAVKLLSDTSVYLGLETVSIPGKMEVTPQHVEEIIQMGTDCGVDGYVLSWDLLHTPLENVLPLRY